jgi:aspartate racemase
MEEPEPAKLLGILGGMGPLATVQFFHMLLEETGATEDEQHVPVLIYSRPQIPSRPKALLEGE